MRLLFLTQKVDKEDDILGIYHEWIKELAKGVERINVICLFKGNFDLPKNVGVFSLGKESGESNLKYIVNFYSYIFRLKKDYDIVFVHMNPGYILLGFLFWKILGKKIVYWNANYKITPLIKIGIALADKGLTSIPEAFAVRTKKISAVGQGIDTDLFSLNRGIIKKPKSILFLGRISPVKNLDILIKAVRILYDQGIEFILDIVGVPANKDKSYFDEVKTTVRDLEQRGIVNFLGNVPNYKTPNFYNSHNIYVNLTESRSFDKSILEAMACQSLILVSNSVYKRLLPQELNHLLTFKERDPEDLADKINNLFSISDNLVQPITSKLREIVVKDHSIYQLVPKLITHFNQLMQ
jgi:glycosyltransferase involved in cell wall biosynthesis